MNDQNDLHFQIFDRLGNIDGKLESLLIEARKTNGRILKLEEDKGEMNVRFELIKKAVETSGEEQRKTKVWYGDLWAYFIKGVVGIVWVIIAGLALIVLQRTGVINIS